MTWAPENQGGFEPINWAKKKSKVVDEPFLE
ncbi:Uncharacterised protein [uncultured archaeon]|nr:Uncharacterised protein [uncultured archaeon]